MFCFLLISFFLYCPFFKKPTGNWDFSTLSVGLSPNCLPASRFRDKWQIWDGKRKTCFSPSRIVTFLPVQSFFVPAGPKCDVFREGCDKKREKLKKIFKCARASHSSQKCDKCNAWHFLSPKTVTNVTSLTQFWDGDRFLVFGLLEPGKKLCWDPKKLETLQLNQIWNRDHKRNSVLSPSLSGP